MNTKISYLYRDADNYKMHNKCVIAGTLTTEQARTIKDSCEMGEYFIPRQVGLPERRFDRYDPAVDHCWFKLDEDCFSETIEPPMPLTADLYDRNEYGEFDDSSTLLEGRELRDYQDQITAALVKNRMPEETERGLMHWYDEADSVDRKVHSAVFTVEKRDRQLWGVAECRVAGELSDTKLETLKGYLTGQASDGWCEGFEQREISVDDGGELYVHFWNSDEWSIQTEQELFSPKLAEGLPELCFSTLPGTGELICIKRGESGYYPSDWSTNDPAHNREIADYNNERLGVTQEQRLAMECGSMHGWGVPGADPKTYEQNGMKMGGMTLG